MSKKTNKKTTNIKRNGKTPIDTVDAVDWDKRYKILKTIIDMVLTFMGHRNHTDFLRTVIIEMGEGQIMESATGEKARVCAVRIGDASTSRGSVSTVVVPRYLLNDPMALIVETIRGVLLCAIGAGKGMETVKNFSPSACAEYFEAMFDIIEVWASTEKKKVSRGGLVCVALNAAALAKFATKLQELRALEDIEYLPTDEALASKAVSSKVSIDFGTSKARAAEMDLRGCESVSDFASYIMGLVDADTARLLKSKVETAPALKIANG
jgi:hypothetical protein